MHQFRLVLACALLLGVIHTHSKELTPDVIQKARLEAEQILRTQMGLPSSGSRSGSGPESLPPVHLSDHSYVKLNELTEFIGFESNKNILAYQDLLRQGYLRQDVLNSLSVERPDICVAGPAPGSCSPTALYRTINGTCNNLQNPLWGSTLSPFIRVTDAVYADGWNEQRGGRNLEASRLPNVRLVSTSIHGDLVHPDPTITNMVPIIGLMVDHDMTLTPEGDKPCCTSATAHAEPDCWSIPVYANDSFYSAPNRQQRCLDFTRSTPYCFPNPVIGVREQMNINTAFLDASFVYGSDEERAHQLRSGAGGRLRVNEANPRLLPTVAEVEAVTGDEIEFMGTFLAGDERVNEMPELTTMHTLWFREHNRIADAIVARRPGWDDETVYQEARRILSAEWQNVVYSEYLPVILGPKAMSYYGLVLPAAGTHTVYKASSNPTLFHAFSTAAYRFGHTLINGLVRLYRDLAWIGSYNVRDVFFESYQVLQGGGEGVELILNGLTIQNAQTYDEHVTEDLTNFVLRNKENDFGSDLVARNLQRGRDHGLPGYNAYRVVCGMPQLTTWVHRPAEISAELWSKLQSLYDRPVDIDLFTAGIVEYPVEGGVSGTVFNCLKSIQFSRVKDGDRFFFTHAANPKPFTSPQLASIRARRLSDIICENTGIHATAGDVFRNSGGANPLLPCGDVSRPALNFDLLLD